MSKGTEITKRDLEIYKKMYDLCHQASKLSMRMSNSASQYHVPWPSSFAINPGLLTQLDKEKEYLDKVAIAIDNYEDYIYGVIGRYKE